MANFYSGTCASDDCGIGEVEVVINILTDNYGGETSWTVDNSDNGDVYGMQAEPGGSTVTFFNLGMADEYSEYRKNQTQFYKGNKGDNFANKWPFDNSYDK